MTKGYYFLILFVLLFSCKAENKKEIQIDKISNTCAGWHSKIVANANESYIGWDVEIGDADNDGKNEILTTGCPSSALYVSKLENNVWNTKMMINNLAKTFPGMGLTVKVIDLNNDGANEIILGTGQEQEGGTAFYYSFRLEDSTLKILNVSRPKDCNKSSYTHDLAAYDIDNGGILEVIAAYCGGGEIIRYDFSKDLKTVNARKIYNLSGSGEETLIADVDNDGKIELIVSNGFRKDAACVEIFKFDEKGELIIPPSIVINGYDSKKCFYASIIIGDVDNDGKNEMVIGWKENQRINKGTILGYKVNEKEVRVKYTFAYDDEALDMSYFEKMMVIKDADNDGKNELVVSTRGDNQSENIESTHLGYIFMYSIKSDSVIKSDLIVDLKNEYAESSWIDVGDADNDRKNEIVLATGKGDRTKLGKSYVIIVKKDQPN
jgi:hypothetical protein